jgi:hypothetical protein
LLRVSKPTIDRWIAEKREEGICWVCCDVEIGKDMPSRVAGTCVQCFSCGWKLDARHYRTAAILERIDRMGWKEAKAAAAAQAGFLSLQKDKESAVFVPLTEPEPKEVDGYRKGTTRQVYRVYVVVTPILDAGNFVQLDMGVRAFNAYCGMMEEGKEGSIKLRITRNGKPKSQDTFYTFKPAGKPTAAESKIIKAARKLAAKAAKTPF